jgi:lipopolysaccharide/colanic/teichoic acid biosynthesis glycosyltransferase
MLVTAIRDEASYVRARQPRLPERLAKHWQLALIGGDVLAALAASYFALAPLAIAPAVCLIVCGAIALCRGYHFSYAVHWRDEVYHVLAGGALAALPLWVLLYFVAGLPWYATLIAPVCAMLLTGSVHAALHVTRHPDGIEPYAGSRCVFPEAQWNVHQASYRVWKACFDVVLSAVGLVLVSPIMAIAALCILAESGRPIFFRQERVGRGGTRFSIFKFRTMKTEAGGKWAKPGDPRITRVGSVLRRFSVDELPQLINVLVGEMSLVGPRPEMDQFATEFASTIPHYDERHIVQPGITGWAQIHLKRNLEPDDMAHVVLYDLFYVNNSSLVLDTIVVLKTAAEFLFHRAV